MYFLPQQLCNTFNNPTKGVNASLCLELSWNMLDCFLECLCVCAWDLLECLGESWCLEASALQAGQRKASVGLLALLRGGTPYAAERVCAAALRGQPPSEVPFLFSVDTKPEHETTLSLMTGKAPSRLVMLVLFVDVC